MIDLSVILTITLLVLASQLAARMKLATVLPADPLPGVLSAVLDSTFNAAAGWNRAETTPQELLTSRA